MVVRKKIHHQFFLPLVVSFIILYIFLAENIFYSQLISPIYPKLVNSDESATVAYLKRIKSLSFFPNDLNAFEGMFGSGIVQQVFLSDSIRNIEINKFEQYLRISPHSRDALYNLYLLYKEKGETKLSENYLQKAKAIDPTVK